MRIAAAVMAGGLSSRMGRDKALADWGGMPAWKVQVRTLRAAGFAPVFMARARGQSVPAGLACMRDRLGGRGPLAGLEAALARAEASGTRFLAVLAVDMPGVDAAFFLRLRRLCAPGCGAVPRHAEAWEPLAALYPVGAAPFARRRLLRGQGSLQGWVDELAACGLVRAARVAVGDQARLRSRNTPDPATPPPRGP